MLTSTAGRDATTWHSGLITLLMPPRARAIADLAAAIHIERQTSDIRDKLDLSDKEAIAVLQSPRLFLVICLLAVVRAAPALRPAQWRKAW